MNLYSSFYREIEAGATAAFPSLAESPGIAWDHLIAPYCIDLPKSVLAQVQAAVRSLYQMSRRPDYQTKLGIESVIPFKIHNDSVLMAYDFHIDETGCPRLIEINTNASSYIVAALMNSTHEGQSALVSPALAELRRSFEAEMAKPTSSTVAIVDDDTRNQKMYLEFLMYRDLFAHWGWPALIGEAAELRLADGALNLNDLKVDFVYNRCTDFYFTEPGHAALREAWQKSVAVVSPQPREYFLLADKQRLIDFSSPGWLEAVGATEAETAATRAILIPSFDKSEFGSAEQLWEKRKTLFFKPKRSYGGKSVYRGESVSRKVFDRLMAEDPLIQKYVPATRFPTDSDESMKHWKFDVRFYVYRDQVQQVAARTYQGQVTNFASPLGGFTRVRFV